MKSFIAIIVSVLCSLAAVAAPQGQTEKNPPPLDPKNIDPSVKPGDDFFNYANGSWINAAGAGIPENRGNERSTGCAEGDRTAAQHRYQRVFQFWLGPGREGQ